MKKSFSARIEELRGTQTQKEFAKKLGIPLNTYTNWTREVTAPTSDSLIDIHTVLGVSTDWLLGISPYKYGSSQAFAEKVAEPKPYAVPQSEAIHWRDIALSQQATIASLTEQLAQMGKARYPRARPVPLGGKPRAAG